MMAGYVEGIFLVPEGGAKMRSVATTCSTPMQETRL
jgi:hypothetical protein